MNQAELDFLYRIGQALGEGVEGDPEHPLETVFQFARHFRVMPSQVLAEPNDLYQLFVSFLSGHARGREIVAKRKARR